MLDLSGKRVWVAGHRGMVGSALLRRLARERCEVVVATRAELDLTRQDAVEDWMQSQRPEVVFLAAARVGGIEANRSLPASFIGENLAIALNVVTAAHRIGVRKLLFLGSSCVYPREAAQPITEDALLSGPLEPTNEWYAVAKIAGIKLCQAFRSQYGDDFIVAMPTNLYGPGDNYHPEHSHVPAALIRRFHEAKLGGDDRATVWGSGRALREFMHVDDLADACVHLVQRYSGDSPVNVGTGVELSIRGFAALVARVVGFQGHLEFDESRPDGAPRKLLDVGALAALGWRARIELEAGLRDAYADFLGTRAEGVTRGSASS